MGIKGDWIPIDKDLIGSPEVYSLADKIGQTERCALGLLVEVWVYCARHFKKGSIEPTRLKAFQGGIRATDTEIQALIDDGWLVLAGGSYSVKGWEDYAGARFERLEKERDRKARGRSADVPRTHEGSGAEVPGKEREKEEEREEEKDKTDSPAASAKRGAEPDDKGPPVMEFATTGTQKTWILRKGYLDYLQEAYTELDVLAECRKAKAYYDANGLKTASGMKKALVNWLNRAVEYGANGRKGKGSAMRPIEKREMEKSQKATESFYSTFKEITV